MKEEIEVKEGVEREQKEALESSWRGGKEGIWSQRRRQRGGEGSKEKKNKVISTLKAFTHELFRLRFSLAEY